MAKRGRAWRAILIIPPVAAGVALVTLAMGNRKPPQRVEANEPARAVRVVKAVSGTITPHVQGYGLIRPGRVWEAVAQVAGPVVWVNPKAQAGTLLAKGTQLIRIDPAEYEAALEQALAELQAKKVKLASTDASLKLEERSAALLKADLDRKRQLGQRGNASDVVIEAAERAFLAAQAKVQGYRNTIAETRAELKVLEARVATAKLNLARTTIAAPFDIRISARSTEIAQFAGRGAVLLKADGTGVAETTAHIPAGRMGPLVRGNAAAGWMVDDGDEARGGPLSLSATVILRRGNHTVTWKGRVARVSPSVDPLTQTIGVVVAVDNPYGQAEPGKRPPLVPNTFVEVRLSGAPRSGQILVPRSAVHGDKVYVVSASNRLEIRSVRTGFGQGRVVVIQKRLKVGERVVVGELIPAVAGMLLSPKPDRKLTQQLQSAAGGTAAKGDKGKRQ